MDDTEIAVSRKIDKNGVEYVSIIFRDRSDKSQRAYRFNDEQASAFAALIFKNVKTGRAN